MMLAEEVHTTFEIDKSSWTRVKLGDVVREVRETVKDPAAEGIERIVGLEHLEPENLHIKTWGALTDGTTFSKVFRKGHVLFGRRRAYLKKAALATFDGICSGDITVLEAKKGLLPELLPFLIQNDKFFELAVKNSAGSLSPRAKFNDFADYEFLLPPIDQQEQIAEMLWAGDELVEREIFCSPLLKNLRLSYISSLPKIGNQSLVDCGFKIIDGDRGKNYPNSSEFQNSNEGYCLFLNAGNVTKNGFDFTKTQFISKEKDSLLRNGKLQRGDIILTTRGTVGNFAYYDDSVPFENVRINSGMVIIRNTDKEVNSELFYILCKNGFLDSEIERRAYGTAQPQLSVKIISELKAPILTNDTVKKILGDLTQLEQSSCSFLSEINASRALLKTIINQIF